MTPDAVQLGSKPAVDRRRQYPSRIREAKSLSASGKLAIHPVLAHRCFHLAAPNRPFAGYPVTRLIHIAGMVRHLAIQVMRHRAPQDVSTPDAWLDQFVAGHRRRHLSKSSKPHAQLSYIPLPTPNTADRGMRIYHILLTAPAVHATWLDHVADRLAHRQLQPRGNEFGYDVSGVPIPPPLLQPAEDDNNLCRSYLASASVWTSVTPVILPGFDDRRPEKTRMLLAKALHHAGYPSDSEVDWKESTYCEAMHPDCHSNQGRSSSRLIRPGHHAGRRTVHVHVRFDSGGVRGPVVLGAGRHFGFGLMASCSINPKQFHDTQ